MYNQLLSNYDYAKDKLQKEAKYRLERIENYKKLIEIFNKYENKYLYYKKKDEAQTKKEIYL